MTRTIIAPTCARCLTFFYDDDEVVKCRKCAVNYCSAECRSEDLKCHRAICAEVSRVGLEQHFADTEAREEALVAQREHGAEAQDATCYICLDGGESEPLVRNCGCRGTSGHAHLSCLAEMARNDDTVNKHSNLWSYCPNCNQSYRGYLDLALAWESWRTYASEPEDDWRRLWAMETLTTPLLDSKISLGNMHVGLVVVKAHIDTLAEHFPDRETLMLEGLLTLSEAYHKLWRKDEALSVCQDVYDRYNELKGPAHISTLETANRLSYRLRACGLFASCRELLQNAYPLADRELERDSAVTSGLRYSLAFSLFRDGEAPREDLAEAAALMRLSSERSQRLYGPNDSYTVEVDDFLAKIERALEAPEADDAAPAAKRARHLRIRDVHGHNDDRVLPNFTSRAKIRESEALISELAAVLRGDP